ncbi:MAG: hypothetical protein P8123_09205 [bacterium]|jgi:hypothetical protein
MRKEYDFSKGQRGKFYKAHAKFNLPVYLDRENLSFVQRIAERKDSDVSSVVNNLIRSDRRLAEAIE